MENGSNSLEYMLNAPLDTILALKGPHGGPPMASKGPHLAINIPFCANGGPKLFLCGPNSENGSVSIDLSMHYLFFTKYKPTGWLMTKEGLKISISCQMRTFRGHWMLHMRAIYGKTSVQCIAMGYLACI